jgi:amidohydrolase
VNLSALRTSILEYVDQHAAVLLDVSHSIHAKPELGFEEHHAHDLLCSVLRDAGLDTESSAYGLPTAFQATAGSGDGPLIAILLEYDALPEIGHACGHNVIASAGLGAGLAAAHIADQTGGRVLILGTPAEEGGGGKVILADRGALDGVAAAMMIHPGDADLLSMNAIALQRLTANYKGQASHAAAAPWAGKNALDAAVLGYMNIAALRQHITPDERIHGIFTHGGDKPNIVPHRAESLWYVRSPTIASLQPLKARVETCLEAGAAASGCSCTLTWNDGPETYWDMRDNLAMLGSFADNAEALGRPLGDPRMGHKVTGSTDMGNISYRVPSIHPMLQVAPRGVPIHSPEFTAYAGAAEGDDAVLDGAKAMALTVLDLWSKPGVLAAATEEFMAGNV